MVLCAAANAEERMDKAGMTNRILKSIAHNLMAKSKNEGKFCQSNMEWKFNGQLGLSWYTSLLIIPAFL